MANRQEGVFEEEAGVGVGGFEESVEGLKIFNIVKLFNC